MMCGLGLGILLGCFLQAEHVWSSWGPQEPGFQNHQHAGFLQHQGPAGEPGLHTQNRARRVFTSPRSVQSSSFNPAGPRGSGPGPAGPQPARTSVRLVQSSFGSRPDWPPGRPGKVPAPPGPKSLGVSAAVAGASGRNQNFNRTWSAQQGRPGTSRNPPSRKAWSSGPGPAAAAPPTRAASSTLFSPVGPAPPASYTWMQTYARGPARKVSRGRSGPPKASGQSSQTGPGRPAGNQRLPGGYKPGSTGLTPRSRNPGQGNPGQGARHRPVSRGGGSARGFAPATVHEIPAWFGGSSIRRLKGPVQAVQNRRPQQNPTPPPERRVQYQTLKTQRAGSAGSRWTRV